MRTTAIFKCVVTLSNGMHKIVRMTIDKVAKLCTAFRQKKEMPWLQKRYDEFFGELGIRPNEFVSCRFINERTGEELLSLA